MKNEKFKKLDLGVNYSDNKIFLTKRGIEEKKERLHELVNVSRPQNLEGLSKARGQGDLSENADYDIAKDKQAEIEQEIIQLEEILSSAQVIIPSKNKSGRISLGNEVWYIKKNDKTNTLNKLKIVGFIETNLLNDIPFIGEDTPIAKALLDKSVGDTVKVDVETPYYITIKEIK